jgi:hypothetical protein
MVPKIHNEITKILTAIMLSDTTPKEKAIDF